MTLWLRGAMLARPTGERPITELWGAEKLGRSDGSGMLIGDPLVEGSSASSTDGELWRAENSFLGMRGTQLPMRSSRAENSLLRVRPITSSGEWRTHSSEWEGTPPLRRERQAPSWALEGGELIPQNERELRRSEGSGMLIGGPLGEGSNAGSTNSELWGAEHSFLRMSGHSDAPKGAAYS